VKTVVARRKDAERIAKRAENVDIVRARARERYPWAKALDMFLTPQVASPTSDPKWPKLADVASSLSIPLSTVEHRSAMYGWLKQQAEAEDRYWCERNDAMRAFMNRRITQIQGAAFTVAGKLIQDFLGKLNQPVSVADAAKIVRANQQALDTALMAAGLAASKMPIAAGEPVVTAAETIVSEQAFDAQGHLLAFNKTHSMSIFSQILAAREEVAAMATAPRREVGPSDPPPFDLSSLEEPSTLPPHLQACRGGLIP